MASLTAVRPRAVIPGDCTKFVEDILDELTLTDREYHHLNLDVPLASRLVEAVVHHRASGRALVVGGNLLLTRALLSLGLDVDLWRLPGSHLTPEEASLVTREVTLESLGTDEISESTHDYDFVIAPLVLESVTSDDVAFLRGLRRHLSDDGRLLLATRNQSRFTNRLAALLGRSFCVRRSSGPLSYSWPQLPVVHEYHREELAAAARKGGLVVQSLRSVPSRRPLLELEVLPVESYLTRKAGQVLSTLIPNGNEVLFLSAAKRPGDNEPLSKTACVTVVLAVKAGGESLRRALTGLAGQTYPADLLDVVVLDDGAHGDVSGLLAEVVVRTGLSINLRNAVDGPSALNAVLRESPSDVIAGTDDCCFLPPDWIEVGMRHLDEDAAVVSGPVFAAADSLPAYLDAPGMRPDWGDREPRRTDLFPFYNTFYRRSVVLAAGGFDDAFDSEETTRIGWDTELAWRIQRLGWAARFRDELGFGRRFLDRGSLADHVRFGEALAAFYADTPELRKTLVAGMFASRPTMYFDVMLGGIVAAILRRNTLWLLTSLPWLGLVSRRFGIMPGRWVSSTKVAVRMALTHGAWLAGLIKGSIKTRRPVL